MFRGEDLYRLGHVELPKQVGLGVTCDESAEMKHVYEQDHHHHHHHHHHHRDKSDGVNAETHFFNSSHQHNCDVTGPIGSGR